MKLLFPVLCLLAFAACSHKSDKQKEVKPNIAFEISEGILHPESIIYSPQHGAFFVSNVASGNPMETKPVGYLSKISKDGKVINAKWVTGMHAPKGIAIVGDDLYVTDVTRVHKVSISKSKITKTFQVKNSKFLNDAVADANGNVYVSDMFSDILYRIINDKLSVWVQDPKLEGSNGLFTDGKEHLLVVKWGTQVDPKTFQTKTPGDMAIIPLAKTSDINVVKEIQGHLDGITVDAKGVLWISDWMNGDIFTMSKSGKVKKMFNFGQGTADISVAKELDLLMIPQMNQSKIIFIQL
ncbi:MAG: SMP-30/gluconolactonase/LRE family protein [Bdellovibrionales bacterium]|nr:SMP-30/gluconolactonase/LRE family protein [Bdellovibrionales bacterium]